MNEIDKLELLSESLKNEIDELQSLLENSDDCLLKAKRNTFQKALKNIISNLDTTNNAIYNIYEELNVSYSDYEEIEEKNILMEDILSNSLSYEDKQYLKIKHNIELY